METASYKLKTDLLSQSKKVEAIVKNEESSSFFVLNYSDVPDSRTKQAKSQGLIAMTVMVDNQARMVRVPHSWVPIDLGLQAPKIRIKESAEFQRALAAKALIVLTDEEAHAIINNDDMSRQEYSRIMAVAMRVNGDDDGYYGAMGEAKTPDDPWSGVNEEIKLKVEQLETSMITEDDMRMYLRRNSRSVTNLDRQYITDKLPLFDSMGN